MWSRKYFAHMERVSGGGGWLTENSKEGAEGED